MEIEAQSTFALIAELAVGLAGFAGVAAAFGGRDRAYARVELTRMRALFVHAALVLAVSLLATSLLWSGFALQEACSWAAGLGLAGSGLLVKLRQGHTRRIAGVVLILGGLWTAGQPLYHQYQMQSGEMQGHHHHMNH